MTSLKFLYLRLQKEQVRSVQRVLNPVLRQCTFSLETLFISDYLDLTKWIPRQESITGIGIFADWRQEPDEKQLSVYQALLQDTNPDRSFSLWTLLGGTLTQTIVYAYPAFTRQWSAKPIWDSLERTTDLRYVWRFKLRLTRLADEDALRSVLASVSQYFMGVTSLELVVHERDIHLNPEGVSSALSLIPNLRVLGVGYDDVDRSRAETYQKNRNALAVAWRAHSPNLRWVWFPDDSRS